MRFRLLVAASLLLAATFGTGCGSAVPTIYAHRVVGAEGQAIDLDEVRKIVTDPGLNDVERRQALRDLGFEDEILIEALLGL